VLIDNASSSLTPGTPTVTTTWDGNQFAFHAPQAYQTNYSRVREICTWSEPITLLEHIRSEIDGNAYGWGDDLGGFNGGSMGDNYPREAECCRRTWHLPTRVCRHRERDEVTGDEVEWTITRIGPFTALKAHAGPTDMIDSNNGWHCFTFPAATPSNADGRTVFVTESLDAYYEATSQETSELRDVGYPPIHPHHSNVIPARYRQSAVWQSPSSEFHALPAFVPRTAEYFASGAGLGSMNTPGNNADLVACEGGNSTAACFYVAVPRSLGARVGFAKPANTDLWSNTIVNTLSDANGRNASLVMEYARRYVIPSQPQQWTPLFSFDFSVVGSGTLYHPALRRLTEPLMRTGMAWHTYTMPRAGTWVASWMHTHSQAPSEMFVLDTHAEAAVPPRIVAHCAAIGGCGVSSAGGTAYGVLPKAADIALEPLNTTAHEVRAAILSGPAASHVRCAYRSTNLKLPNSDVPYIRGAMREANGKCDGWRFEAGERISLIAFQYETGVLPPDFGQHQRWFATAAFEGLDVSELGQPPSEKGVPHGDPMVRGSHGQEIPNAAHQLRVPSNSKDDRIHLHAGLSQTDRAAEGLSQFEYAAEM